MTFKEWIRKYDGDFSSLGDLAGDIMCDDRFPQVNEYSVAYSHLVAHNACESALSTLSKAWRLYESERGL